MSSSSGSLQSTLCGHSNSHGHRRIDARNVIISHKWTHIISMKKKNIRSLKKTIKVLTSDEKKHLLIEHLNITPGTL